MLKGMVKFCDFILSACVTAIFLSFALIALILSKFIKNKHGSIKEISQLCISIIDFRDSVLSSYKSDLLLDGFINKSFCYHFDFDKPEDESVYIEKNIYMSNMSVHPYNAFTRAGFRKTMACFVEIRAFFEMLGVMKKEDINIIRAHDPHLLGFNAYLLSRLGKAPFIVQVCSNYEVKDRQAKGLTFRPFLFKGIERAFERAIMRASDLVLTDREHYRSFGLIPADIPSEKYGNMGFFVDSVHYAPPDSRKNLRGELKIPPENKILLYVGRLAEVKYPLDLIRIFALCREKRQDLTLLIAGDGTLRDEMERLAREAGIEADVIFLKKAAQDRISDLYHTADIVCFTSAGFTMIEAALAEKCVIAYDFEWHGEFIGANERGIVVPFRDTGAFAKEILRVLADPKLMSDTGKAARAYALGNYSRKSAIEKEIKFYKRVFDYGRVQN